DSHVDGGVVVAVYLNEGVGTGVDEAHFAVGGGEGGDEVEGLIAGLRGVGIDLREVDTVGGEAGPSDEAEDLVTGRRRGPAIAERGEAEEVARTVVGRP